MKRYIISVVTLCLGFLFGVYVNNHIVTAVTLTKVPETVEEWIVYYAEQNNINAQELDSVIFCESSYNVVASGDGGRAWSVAQFHKPTFDKWKKEMGQPSLNYYNFQHQIKVMAWAFSKGETYKDDWTCWKG